MLVSTYSVYNDLGLLVAPSLVWIRPFFSLSQDSNSGSPDLTIIKDKMIQERRLSQTPDSLGLLNDYKQVQAARVRGSSAMIIRVATNAT